jgi:prenyltransferase beta subunit
MRFLDRYPLYGLNYLYYCAFTLDLLGRAGLLGARRLAQIHDLPLSPPPAGDSPVTDSWLEGTLRALQLKRRFTALGQCPAITGVIQGLKADGGYGGKPNLWDTYLCLSMLVLLGERPGDDTRDFVNRLQRPSFGFVSTEDSSFTNLDLLFAGTSCCQLLGMPVKYPADTLAFALSCQTRHGGFSRTPDALPNIVMTHRALQIIQLIEPARGRFSGD